MICGYCEEEIGPDEQYIYKYFPEQKKTLPVHAYHLDGKKGMKDGQTDSQS